MNKSIDGSDHESEVVLADDKLPDEIERFSMRERTSFKDKTEILDQSQ